MDILDLFLEIWDSFRGLLTEDIKSLLRRKRINVVVIPGGLTPLLQPLNCCINKPFKDKVRPEYCDWLVKGPFQYTPTGRNVSAKETMLQWIDKSWMSILSDLIIKSFQVCGITNATDRTEDENFIVTEELEEAEEDQMVN